MIINELLIFLSISFAQAKEYEIANLFFENTRSSNSKFLFYRMITSYELNDKDKTIKYADEILESFQKQPRRYLVLAELIRSNVEEWNDQVSLSSVERKMNNVARRLSLAKAGIETQKQQQSIVDDLDQLIKREEEKNNPSPNNENSNNGDNSEENTSKQINQSQIENNFGKGLTEDQKFRKLVHNWGKLPPAKRAEVIKELNKSFPEKFKPIIEDYYKSLNKK